jgi:nucleoside-diphosphate-sugar epimerase|tara:strand:- start:2507 stop:3334 length:828 start_codon:yes stop_codon:yes gene_type:complete
MNDISVFGSTGYIGSTFCRMYPDKITPVPREEKNFLTDQALYFISTTTNQSVFKDLHVDIDTNLSLFIDILSNCRDRDVIFNFISSGFVYGNDVLDYKEWYSCNPTGFYSITKRTAEQLLISYCKTFGIKYRILRIGNVYGLDKTVTPGKNVLGYMISLLKKNEPIKLFDGGDYLKDYMSVNDVCRAIDLIIEKGEVNEIYNIASGTSQSFRSIIITARDILGSKSELIDVPMPENQKYIQVKNMTLNTEKLQDLGFSCEMSFYQGLQTLCDVIE